MISGEQFSVAYEGQSDLNTHTPQSSGWHSVVARTPSGDVAGQLHWRKNSKYGIPGQIDWVDVAPEHQRKGLATRMLKTAEETGVRPSPKHSPERTDAGDAWAKKVGGRLPRRRE